MVLPTELAPLMGLRARWALSDDQERTEKIEAAQTRSLSALVATVEPLLAAIEIIRYPFANAQSMIFTSACSPLPNIGNSNGAKTLAANSSVR